MKKVLFYFFLLILLTGLTGCGGGGDTSSGGGSVSSEYIGTYKGTMIMNITGSAGNISQSLPITVLIANDGKVDASFEGVVSNGSCSDGSPVYLSGNSFNDSATLTCSFPDLGTCTVTATMNGVVASNAISGTGKLVYKCTAGNFTANLSYTASKIIVAQSFSGLSNQPFGSSLLNTISSKGLNEMK